MIKKKVDKILINIQNKVETQINIKDAIDMITASWDNVTNKTIKNCFRKAGFILGNVSMDEEVLDEDGYDERNWRAIARDLHLPNNVNFQDFIHVDDAVQIAPILTDAEIVAAVQEKKSKQNGEEEEYHDDADIEPTTRIKTTSDAMLWIEELRVYLQSQPELPEQVVSNLDKIHDYVRGKAVATRQQKITDFFLSN